MNLLQYIKQNYDKFTDREKLIADYLLVENSEIIDMSAKEIAEETLRLLYVGITRAKKELYISCSNKNKYSKKQTPSVIFSKVGGKNEW